MDDIDKNIEKYNPNKKQKILIVFDDMTTDMINLIAIELFIKSRKLNTSVISIILSSFAVHLLKILNKQVLQQMAFTHSSDIDLREFMKNDEKTGDKTQYLNRELVKIMTLSSGKSDININISQVKKYYLLIKVE